MKRPAAEILTVGNELLKGHTLNTNALFLGRELTNLGFEVKRQTSCPDDIRAIREALAEAAARSRVIIVTGGLGPTPDDLTREGIAEYFGVPLKSSAAQLDIIKQIYKARRTKMPESVRKEALFPANAVPLVNNYGIALAFYILTENLLVIVLPGVPREQEKMFENRVKPILLRRFRGIRRKFSLTVRIAGLSEPVVIDRLGEPFFKEEFDFGIYPFPGEIILRIQAETGKTLRTLKGHIKKKLGVDIYCFSDEPLSEIIGEILVRKNKSLAIAESCTGGGLSAEFVKIPGSSRFLKGCVVAYSNEVKVSELDVSEATLRTRGAVSSETAREMARGARIRLNTDYAISITGIAGPSGGTKTKPVGTVYIGFADRKRSVAWHHVFSGDREYVQQKTIHKALEHCWRLLR